MFQKAGKSFVLKILGGNFTVWWKILPRTENFNFLVETFYFEENFAEQPSKKKTFTFFRKNFGSKIVCLKFLYKRFTLYTR